MVKKITAIPVETTDEKQKLIRISKERDRLLAIYKDLPGNARSVIEKLIDNAAFMSVALEDLQAQINLNGFIEEYRNGENQYGKKKSSEIEIYNVMIKNYKSVVDSLSERLPKSEGVDDDGFEDFRAERED